MVDKIEKFFRKQNKKGRKAALDLIEKIRKGELQGCDITKIKGKKALYRLRKGRVRIIFEEIDGQFITRKITYRDDQTYSDF